MIIPLGFSQVTLGFDGNGLPYGAACTFGIDQGGDASPAELASDIGDAFVDSVLPLLSDQVGLTSVTVKFGPNATGAVAVWPFDVNGGDSDDGDFPQACYLVRKFTALGGANHRGRWYLPGVAPSALTLGGAVDGTKVTALNTALEDFRVACGLIGAPLVLLHTPASSDDVPTPIVALVCQGQIATQRRRNRR